MTTSSAFVPRFLTVTFAPGTAAPLASVTVPPIAPSVVDCAKAPKAKTNIAVNAPNETRQSLRQRPVLLFFMRIPPGEVQRSVALGCTLRTLTVLKGTASVGQSN